MISEIDSKRWPRKRVPSFDTIESNYAESLNEYGERLKRNRRRQDALDHIHEFCKVNNLVDQYLLLLLWETASGISINFED